MTGTVLALSPHLDDAAFSCGGTLASLVDAGCRVVVATVFTLSVPNPTGFALACQLDKGLAADVDYMALRREEDATAMRVLGAEPLWLSLPEAPHRGYRSAAALFAGRHGDDAVVPKIATLVRDLVDRFRPTLILAPRCIGSHVDHHAVRDALESLRLSVPVALWTDYPYALRAGTDDTGPGRFAVLMDAAASRRKIGASCAYTSQIGFQFGGVEKLAQALGASNTELFEADPEGRAKLFAMLSACVHA